MIKMDVLFVVVHLRCIKVGRVQSTTFTTGPKSSVSLTQFYCRYVLSNL